MVTTFSFVDLQEHLLPLFWLDTILQEGGCASLVHLHVDDGVCLGSSLHTPSLDFVTWQASINYVGHYWLCPSRYRTNRKDLFIHIHHVNRHRFLVNLVPSPQVLPISPQVLPNVSDINVHGYSLRCWLRRDKKIDSNSGDSLIDGFLRCSKAMPGRIGSRDEPSLDNMLAASFSVRCICLNSQPSKKLEIFCT